MLVHIFHLVSFLGTDKISQIARSYCSLLKKNKAINLMNFTIYELKYMKICGILNFLQVGKTNECADFLFGLFF